MTIEQAVQTLETYLLWRDGNTYPEPRPANVREAIVVVLEYAKRGLSKGMGEK